MPGFIVAGNPGSTHAHFVGPISSFTKGNFSRAFLLDEVRPDGSSFPPWLGNDSERGRGDMIFARIGRLLYLLGPYFLVMALLIAGVAVCVPWNIRLVMRKFQFADAWPFVLASWLLFLPLLHIEDRYLLPVLPAFLVWLVLIMLALQKLVEPKLPQRYRQFAVFVPLAFIAVFVLSHGYRLANQLPQNDPSMFARNMAGWWKSERLSPAPILSQNPDLAFFTNAEHRWMPAGEPADVLKYAQRNGVNYIFVSCKMWFP